MPAMKRAYLISAAAIAALTLAACQRQEAENPGQSEPVNAAQDAVGAAVGSMSAATLGANTLQGYVSNAAEGDMYEIQAAELAQQKAQNAQVKALAKTIQTDHTQAANEMKPLVQQAAATLPDKLDERRQGMLDNLKAASAADFDKVFLDQQVAAHEEAVTLHSGYAENGDNAALKAHAAKVLPKIKMHLERARELQGSVGATPQNK